MHAVSRFTYQYYFYLDTLQSELIDSSLPCQFSNSQISLFIEIHLFTLNFSWNMLHWVKSVIW